MAEVAQAFAEQCDHTSHDHPEARTTSRFKAVGQCFGWADDPVKQTVTEGKTWADDWFIEYRDYNPNRVASFDTSDSRGVVTHFTQMIWAETRYIGCGFSNFYQGNRYTRIFVCNYAPVGNTGREPIYLPGPTCSECPAGSFCNPATGLCVSAYRYL
ncbi:CRISP/Allergen/PR-1-like [Dermacentor andersoni]|uniref:CRISP/Allergen/PR-1-like n=1 Tax=Dermacentor andersoni TaxID=34620 RepID=UPI003B3A2A8A